MVTKMGAPHVSNLPPETVEILEGLRSFLHTEVIARHERHADLLDDPRRRYRPDGRYAEEVEALQRDVRMASARAGYYHMVVPAELGGGGEGAVTMYAAWELIHRVCGARHWLAHEALAHWATGPSFVFAAASEEARQKVLPQLLSGEKTMCFMMSEPGAGSDVWTMTTRAEPRPGGWRISGTKQWISNGPHADFALVFAVTDTEAARARKGGITAFLVPTDAPGFRLDSVITLYGHIGGNHGILSLDGVEVDETAVVGEPGQGLRLGLGGIAQGRLFNAGKAVGLARWALEQAVEYAKERTTFGVKLIDNQGIAFPLAECATQIYAAHRMGLHAAELVDAGRPALKEVAMAKMFSVEMGTRVIDRAMQTFGGMGLTSEMGFADAWQALRTVQIADGSSEILRRLVAGRLAKGDLDL
jgi:acyl-CoA dehydrogenase